MKKIILALLLCSGFLFAQNADHPQNMKMTYQKHQQEGKFQDHKMRKLPPNCASEEDFKAGKCKMPEKFEGRKGKDFKGENRQESKHKNWSKEEKNKNHKTWNKGENKAEHRTWKEAKSSCDEKDFSAGTCQIN